MNDRRKFLGQFGLGLASLALPGVAQACGRRRRRCDTCMCTHETSCTCKTPALHTNGQQGCPFELTMIMNNIYYYCCYVCPSSPQGYVGEDVNSPGLSTPLSSTSHPCSNCYHGFSYPRSRDLPPCPNTISELDYFSNRTGIDGTATPHAPKGLDKYHEYGNPIQLWDTSISSRRTVWYQDSSKLDRKARLYELSTVVVENGTKKTLPIWCVGQEMKNTPDSPMEEKKGKVQKVESDQDFYHRLTVQRDDGQVLCYHVVLFQK